MNKVEQNIEDVEFILSQLEHYLINSEDKMKTFREEVKKDRLNYMYMLPHPKGSGHLICGREAHKRFFLLAKRYLSTLGANGGTVKEIDYVEILKNEFVRYFLKEGQSISERSTTRMLSRAFEKSLKNHEVLTYYIPCSIVFGNKPLEFEVGAVRFLHKSRFDEQFGDELEAQQEMIAERHQQHCQDAIEKGMDSKRVATEEQSSKLGSYLVDGVKKYFNNYDWVGIVTIGPCHSVVSRERAVLAVTSALNILKLMLSENYSDKIRIGCSPGVMQRRASLIRKSNNQLSISVSGEYDGNMPGDKWFDIISTQGAFFFQTASKTLDIIVDPSKTMPLCHRFLDALTWYGEAVAEQSSSAKVVKYVSAIERMTMTQEKTKVTDIVIKRCCLLCFGSREDKNYEYWETMFKKIYQCRSNLVHGTISPFDQSVTTTASDASYATQQLLLRGLDFFSQIGIEESKYSVKRLKKNYRELEDMYSRDLPFANKPLDTL